VSSSSSLYHHHYISNICNIAIHDCIITIVSSSTLHHHHPRTVSSSTLHHHEHCYDCMMYHLIHHEHHHLPLYHHQYIQQGPFPSIINLQGWWTTMCVCACVRRGPKIISDDHCFFPFIPHVHLSSLPPAQALQAWQPKQQQQQLLPDRAFLLLGPRPRAHRQVKVPPRNGRV